MILTEASTATIPHPRQPLSAAALSTVIELSPVVRRFGISVAEGHVESEPLEILEGFGEQLDEAAVLAFRGILVSTVRQAGSGREAMVNSVQTKALHLLGVAALHRGEMETLRSLSQNLRQIDTRGSRRVARRFEKVWASRSTVL